MYIQKPKTYAEYLHPRLEEDFWEKRFPELQNKLKIIKATLHRSSLTLF